MALNYSVALRPNPQEKDASPKAYATAQINGELTLKQLSKRISSQTTVSRADVVAVLTATVDNLLEALTEGKHSTPFFLSIIHKMYIVAILM